MATKSGVGFGIKKDFCLRGENSMTNEEKVSLDIERAGEFLRYLIENPLEMEKIPNGSHIWFTDSFENSDTEKLGVKENVLNVRKVYEFA
jgi:CRISPR/Cas system CSM-associated protein Csm3 (group 7 of RAMP superfamily)